MQRRIMFALPFVFVIFIINFEAGLILYWITTNIVDDRQQPLVKKLYPKPVLDAEAEADKAASTPARGSRQAPSWPRPARTAATAAVTAARTRMRGGRRQARGEGGCSRRRLGRRAHEGPTRLAAQEEEALRSPALRVFPLCP